tara:strand:- start:36 stop:545 length:510 start_codon:yes stop_codon:yes gene_type:complete
MRLLVGLVLALAIYTNQLQYSTLIWCLIALSDGLDGYLARRLKQATTFGAFLDPLADKVITLTVLWALSYQLQHSGLRIATIVIALRDIAITIPRAHAYSTEKICQFQVSTMSKYKTAGLFMGVYIIMDAVERKNMLVLPLGTMLIYSSSIVSLYTLFVNASTPIVTRE